MITSARALAPFAPTSRNRSPASLRTKPTSVKVEGRDLRTLSWEVHGCCGKLREAAAAAFPLAGACDSPLSQASPNLSTNAGQRTRTNERTRAVPAPTTSTDDDITYELVPMIEEDARLVSEARRLADVFVTEAGQHVAAWIGQAIRNAVTTEPEVTTSLGPRLSELKASLANVEEGAPAKTKALLKDLPWAWTRARDEWPRDKGSHPPNGHSPLHVYEDCPRRGYVKVPKDIEDRLAIAYGEAGPLLKRYGFKAADGYAPMQYQATGHRYRYGGDLSDSAKRALLDASRADDKIGQHRLAISVRRRELSEAKAQDSWENA
jgi:hypothetical protein